MKSISEDELRRIVAILSDFPLNEQLGCLTTLMFSLTINACGDDVTRAEPLVQEILRTLPKHWERTRGMHLFDRLQTDHATAH
jgi:hypothetical protein